MVGDSRERYIWEVLGVLGWDGRKEYSPCLWVEWWGWSKDTFQWKVCAFKSLKGRQHLRVPSGLLRRLLKGGVESKWLYWGSVLMSVGVAVSAGTIEESQNKVKGGILMSKVAVRAQQ